MSFDEYVGKLGFEVVSSTRDGVQRFTLRSNPYLVWWLTTHPNGMAELTWEFELGSYLRAKGFAVSVQDELSLMVFPGSDTSGPAEADWLAGQMEAVRDELGSVDMLKGV